MSKYVGSHRAPVEESNRFLDQTQTGRILNRPSRFLAGAYALSLCAFFISPLVLPGQSRHSSSTHTAVSQGPRWHTAPAPMSQPTPTPTPEAQPSPTPTPAVSPSLKPSPSIIVTTPAPTSTTTQPTPSPSPEPSETTKPSPSDIPSITVQTTGYSGAGVDNDCDGQGGDCTAWGDGHAGGDGTYENPISVAVENGGPFHEGQMFYIPKFQKYFFVEDVCGSCSGNWLDLWVGQTGSEACMSKVTFDSVEVYKDPAADLSVPAAGQLQDTYC